MPIYGDRADLEKLRKTHWCAICGGFLSVWIDYPAETHYLACNDYRQTKHEGITAHNKEHEKYITEVKERYGMDTKALTTMRPEQMLQRVEMGKFPKDLTPQDKRLLVQVAITYGFDPLMGEISIYQGKPYVSIDGRYRKAQETDKFDGVDSRPATKQERDERQIPDGDYYYCAQVWVKGASHTFVGWGRVHKSEMEIKNPGDIYKPVVKDPQRMAEKRAEAQALRKAFHIPLPSIEEAGSPEDMPVITIEPSKESPETDNPIEDKSQVDKTPQEGNHIANPTIPPNVGELYSWITKHIKKTQSATNIVSSAGITPEQINHDLPGCYDLLRKLYPDWAKYPN